MPYKYRPTKKQKPEPLGMSALEERIWGMFAGHWNGYHTKDLYYALDVGPTDVERQEMLWGALRNLEARGRICLTSSQDRDERGLRPTLWLRPEVVARA